MGCDCVYVVPTIIVGDFNVHFDVPAKSGGLRELLATYDLVQHVEEPTHVRGHVLDLVISRAVDHTISTVQVKSMAISDHHSIDCLLTFGKPPTVSTEVSVRGLCKINMDEFRKDLTHCCQGIHVGEVDDASRLTQQYDLGLRDILDKHAPLRRRRQKGSKPCPWYTDEVRMAREKKRLCEHTWRRTKLEVHRQLYVVSRNVMVASIAKAKSDFYKDSLLEANNKRVFSLVKSLGTSQKTVYPDFNSVSEGCKLFSDYFHQKVQKIRLDLDELRRSSSL